MRAEVYARKVERLEEALDDPGIQVASEVLRSLIDRIVLMPGNRGRGVDAAVHGDLATILALCGGAADKKRLPAEEEVAGSQLSVVAGVGFEPTTFRL